MSANDETHPRVLYVGNLDASVSEEFLLHLFGQIGACRGCKIIHEPGGELYAFLEFVEHADAQMALMAMNKRIVLEKEMKVNWASSPGGGAKPDTSNHYHVFVGDMSHEIDSQILRDAFAPFGQISDCKVIRDAQTHKSKGFGFVCFIHKEDAELAIASMNGQWLGGRSIRTNWANGKAGQGRTSDAPQRSRFQTLNYDEVYSQASPTNCTVYCGGIQAGLTDELMRQTFSPFGTVVDVRVFQDKGFSFIKMDSKEAAAQAITETHGTDVGGYSVKCSWGKEAGDVSKAMASSPAEHMPNAGGYVGYGYGSQMAPGYWSYPQQGGYPPQMSPGSYNMQQYGGVQGGYGPPTQQGYGTTQPQGYGGYGTQGMMPMQQHQQQQQQQSWTGSNGSSWNGQ